MQIVGLVLPKIGSHIYKITGYSSSCEKGVFLFLRLFCFPVECHISECFRKNPEELYGFRGQCNKLSKGDVWLRQGDNTGMGITKWGQGLKKCKSSVLP